MPYSRLSLQKTLGSAMLMLAGSVLLSGCALSGGSASSASSAASAAASHGLGGIVHGGQNPVTGATVILWAAGTSGTYGTGATKVATTTTDANGNFSFNNSSGVSPCGIGTYNYLTATGGNSGAGTNNNIAMMAAIPVACSSTSGATTVFIDEVTTVAAVTALQQFMSINTAATAPYTGTGTVPWTIGAPSTNTVGLANAFSITPLLASITTGVSATSFPSNTITPNNATVSQLFTTTVAPELNKINGLANILATCINDTTGNLCTGSAGVLTLATIANSGTTTTYTVPMDTIQAMYNMATLPTAGLYQGTKYWKNSTSTTTYLSTLWANNTSNAPFQPYYASAPADTSISMSWKTTGPTNGTTGTVYATTVAVDGNGYVWYGGGTGVTGNYVTQFTPSGLLLQDVVTTNLPSYTLSFYPGTSTASTGAVTANATQALGYGRPIWSLAIDPSNNAWFNAYGATSPGTIATMPAGIVTEVTQTGVANGFISPSVNGSMAIDNSGNIFMSSQPVSGRYYVSMLSQASSYQSVYEGTGRITGIYNGLAIDSTGYTWGFASTACTGGETIERANAAGEIAATVADVVLPSPYCAYQGAGDGNGNMWTTDGTNLDYVNISSGIATPTVSAAYTGGAGTGLVSVNSLAVDGNGNVWAVNKGTTGTAGSAGVAELQTNGTAGTATILSPTGTSAAPLNGFGSSFGSYLGAPEGLALDPSGNVWLSTTGGSYAYSIIGVAAPTRTPLSASLAHIGTKP